MQTTISRDGTRIAFSRAGTGPALLILGGSLADSQHYAPLAEALAAHFTIFTLDRRGRGLSENTKPYAPEREVEDVAAVMALTTGPIYLYGHSAGAAVALRAAAAGLAVTKMVLADPPYTPRGQNDEAARAEHAEQAAHLQGLNDKGDLKGSVRYFLGGFGMSEEDLEGMLQSPAGVSMIRLAATLPYDYAMLSDGLVPTELAATITTSTLILAPREMPDAALQLVDAMPNAHFEALDAPVHALSPEDIAPILTRFFAG